MWQQWINVVLGLWVVAIPFLGLEGSSLTWTLVVSGLVIAILGLWGQSEVVSEREERRMLHAHQ